MMGERYLFLSFLLIVFWGCVEDVNINLGKQNREFVLNSILTPDKDTVVVYLSLSRSVTFNEKFKPVTNATVEFFEDKINVGKLIWEDSGQYVLPFKVSPNRKYRIEATVDGKTIWAETTLPESIENVCQISNDGTHRQKFQLHLQLQKSNPNYFWLSATGYNGAADNLIKGIANSISSDFEYADAFNRTPTEYYSYKFDYMYYMRFTNQFINKKDVDIYFAVETVERPVEIVLLSTDCHLDKYMKSSMKMSEMEADAGEEGMFLGFAPFPVYTNIHGGTGVFGSFTSVSKEFEKIEDNNEY
jgi:hypothetical protein